MSPETPLHAWLLAKVAEASGGVLIARSLGLDGEADRWALVRDMLREAAHQEAKR